MLRGGLELLEVVEQATEHARDVAAGVIVELHRPAAEVGGGGVEPAAEGGLAAASVTAASTLRASMRRTAVGRSVQPSSSMIGATTAR